MEFYDGFSTGSDIMFNIVPLIVVCGFIFVFGSIIINSIKGISEWSNNNKQPILDVDCKVVSKRMNVTRHAGHHDANGHYTGDSSSTSYYVTFEFKSKDRMEFNVSGTQYGILVEGDHGKLQFQGTRFLSFTRQ